MVTFSMETIGYINLFERLTHAHVKDCFQEEGRMVFLVDQGEISKAVGKGGSNVRRISAAIKKQVKVVEFNHDPIKFLETLLYPIRPKSIVAEDERLIIKANNIKEKGQIYGREKTKLKHTQEILSKYFPHKIELE